MEELELKGLNEKIYVYKTKCGLPIYMWVNEKVSSMYAALSVKYGSVHTKFKIGKKVYEVPDGLAHFLEHIKFNIDEDTTAHDKFYSLGGDANAFTTFDYTSYIVFATSNKKENMEQLLDFVYNPYFTKKSVAKEKGIIVEEANMGLDDAYSIVFFHTLANTLQKSKYRYTITGTPDDVNSISLDDVKLVYDAFYHPNNMFLTITGNFNPYERATSDFKDELMEKGLIQNMSISNDLYDDAFVIQISATTNFKEEVIKRVKEKLKNLVVSEIDFKRKKNATIATLILDFEDLENVSYRIQDDVLNNGGVVTNLKEILENETVEDLRNLISLYDLDNMQISVFLPKENQKE